MQTTTLEPLGRRVLSRRQRPYMSQGQLAKKTGLSIAIIQGIEQGSRPNPTLDTLLKLCRGLNLTLHELLGHDGLHLPPTEDVLAN